MTNDLIRTCAALVLAAGVTLVAGCVDKSNPDIIDKRSVERWNYLIAHEAEKAYDYLTPGYRATQTREAYATAMNNRPVIWKSAEFQGKSCDGDRCDVQVTVTYSMPVPGKSERRTDVTSRQSETWLRLDGQWYYLPND
ncbi:MAG: hypothetical protein KF903_09110 [Dokdonella sp.]|uniref:hypothetical protein n=1 Tax=Dokdonella sp. TaxID=2291710 RepID=UPI0025BF6BD1|nr:hypothetical protein [Dokdonella sp.]MBX3701140.1 hypothetical protein [Dokdonella sp.]